MGESETEESKTRVSEERARKGTPFQSVSWGVMIIVKKKEKKKQDSASLIETMLNIKTLTVT